MFEKAKKMNSRSEITHFQWPTILWKTGWPVVLLLAQLVVCDGCGSGSSPKNTAHLKGNITLQGQPIPLAARASITFKPTRTGQAKTTFASIVDSTYDSPNTPKGPVKVYLAIQVPTGKMVSEAGGAPYAEVRNLVPPSYSNGIDLEVSEDTLEQDFELK
jgi:hypothetical protein